MESDSALTAPQLDTHDAECVQVAFVHLFGQEQFSAQLMPAPFDPSWADPT